MNLYRGRKNSFALSVMKNRIRRCICEGLWRKKKISSLKGKTGQEGEELLARPFELLKETEQVKRLTVQVQKANPKYRYEPYFSAYEDAAVYGDSFAEGGERSYETKFCTASEKRF